MIFYLFLSQLEKMYYHFWGEYRIVQGYIYSMNISLKLWRKLWFDTNTSEMSIN